MYWLYFILLNLVLTDSRLPCGPVPVPRAPSPPLTQSNPNLSANQECPDNTVPHRSAHKRDLSQGAGQSVENISNTTPGVFQVLAMLTEVKYHFHAPSNIKIDTLHRSPTIVIVASLSHVTSPLAGRARPSADHTPPGQKSKVKKKTSKSGQYRRDILQGGELLTRPFPEWS